jgi:hypothetical protein
MVDIDDYINKLHREIEYLRNVVQSLRNEIIQYKETISVIKHTKEMDSNVND